MFTTSLYEVIKAKKKMVFPLNTVKLNFVCLQIIALLYPGQNFIFSPLSIETILSLVYMGAKNQTAIQMQYGLNLPINNKMAVATDFKALLTPYQTDDAIMKIANAIYVGNSYVPQQQFLNYANNDFYAKVQSLNFANNVAAANTINQWVSQKTDNNINDLIQSSWLNPNVGTVLVNAVYFNGLWKHPFEQRMSPKVPFYNSYSSCKKSAGTVDMMTTKVKLNLSSIL